MSTGASNNSLFKVTFGNLRQYVMEQQEDPRDLIGNLIGGHLRLGPTTSVRKGLDEADDKTMQLFPTRPGMTPQLYQDLPEMQDKAPTILYEGQMHVFDHVRRDKAKVPMQQMAGTWSVAQALLTSGSPTGTKELKEAANLPLWEEAELFDMASRRNASLQRFLHKRQHRTPATNYPYQVLAGEKDEVAESSATSDNESSLSTWLRL